MKLPIDCDVSYFSDFITVDESMSLFEAIRSSCTFSNVIEMADGTLRTVGATKCMFADPDIVDSDALPSVFGARYPWLDVVRELKERVEAVSGRDYNVLVCIYYENGGTGVAFHSDLAAFGDVSSIASVSLGQERTFVLRRIDDLEAQLGVTLITRHAAGVRLTAEGETILAATRAMEAAAFSVMRARDAASASPAGEVRIAVTEGLGTFWLAPRLVEFQRSNPRLVVDLRCTMDPADVGQFRRAR